MSVLHDAGEIRVTRTWARHDRPVHTARIRGRLRCHGHRFLPVFPILVWYQQRDWRAGGLAVPDAAQELRAVRLDRHAAPTAVTCLPSLELCGDRVKIDHQPRWNAFDDRDERLAVRFTRGQKSQHRAFILSEKSAHSGTPPAICLRKSTRSRSCTVLRSRESEGGVNVIADRFVAVSDDHAVDLATGERVLSVCTTAGGIAEERRWVLRCEWLFETRHRAIAELVDYGAMSATKRFEAWRCDLPWTRSRSGSSRAAQSAIDAAGRFLRSCGRTHVVQTDTVVTSHDGRALVVPGSESCHSAGVAEGCCELEDCGVAVIPRGAVSALAEMFSEWRPGLRALALCDVPGAGVSTALRELSRAARLAGFVPVALASDAHRTCTAVSGRSLFAIADPRHVEDSWREFLSVTIDTPKPHLLLFAGRDEVPRVQTIHLQRFAPERLVHALRPGVQQGRQRHRIDSAARRARGLPGRFVELLWQLPRRSDFRSRNLRSVLAAESPASCPGALEEEHDTAAAIDGGAWADPNEIA